MINWLQNNPFPDAEEPDVEVWKKYYENVTNDEFVFNLNDRFKSNIPEYVQYHVTKRELQLL